MVKILSSPNPILLQASKPVSKIDGGILALVEQMKQALLSAKDPVGVGLAAPQIGKNLRIFIAKPTDKSSIFVFINPKIIQENKISHLTPPPKKSGSAKLEGCLSLPAIWGNVSRASFINLSYLDKKGKAHKQKFSGFMSKIIQHEMDHLDGVLFPKRVLEQKGKLYKSHKNEKDEDEFEEIEL